MRLLQTLFPGLFASPAKPAGADGVTQLHRALEEIKPSTESLKRKLAGDDGGRPVRSSNVLANRLADRGRDT